MKYAIALLLVLASPVLGADAPPVEGPKDMKKEVDSLVSQLSALEIGSDSRFLDITQARPIEELVSLGMPAVPYLARHLSDKSLTKSRRPVFGEAYIAVNEIVGRIITRCSGHFFYFASGDRITTYLGSELLTDEKQIKLYEIQIIRWYGMRKDWDETERRIDDINDWFHLNRYGAYDFFKKTGDPRGREHLERRIDFLNADRHFAMTAIREMISCMEAMHEMVTCMEALASIGDEKSIPILRSAWKRIYDCRPDRSISWRRLFRAYEARVKIGDDEQALKDLEAYRDRYYSEFSALFKEGFDSEYQKLKKDSGTSKPSDE